MQKKLLIIDDERDFLAILKDYFQLTGYCVLTAESTTRAVQQLSQSPDLIILDVSMPGLDGISFCQQIRDWVHCPIIFLSARVDQASRLEGLVAGGDDYLLKPIDLEELAIRIAAHLRRETRITTAEKILTSGSWVLLSDRKELRYRDKLISVTKTEFEIIRLLLGNNGQVFSKEDIYEAIWGFEKGGDAAIISEHVRRIREKCQQQSKDDVIQTVWGAGYKWIG